MAVLNLRNVPDELAAYLKSEAALAGISLRDYCVEIFKARGEVWPIYSLDGRTGAVSVITNADMRISKKIAEISAGGVGAESGGTPDLPRLGKAQIEEEMLREAFCASESTFLYGRSGVAPDFNEVIIPRRQLADGVPCGHAGCLSHLSHPCEGCGRIGGQLEEGCIMMGGGEDGLCSVASGCRGCSQERAQKNRDGSVSVGYTETRVAEMKEAAKTDKDVACALHTAGVELDRDILVRWGLAENYKPITFEDQRGVPGSDVVANRNQVRPLVDKNKSEDEFGGGKDVEGNKGGKSGASAGKNRRVAKGLPKNDDGGKSVAVGVGKSKVDMAALRDICAGNVPAEKDIWAAPLTKEQVDSPNFGQPIEVNLCGFKSYNEIDGENYVCGKEVHDSKVKHGEWLKV